MTTSTPPAWHWLHECDAPVTMAELSVHSHNLPVADALSEQNDSDQCDECRCPPGQPHNPECNISCSPNVSCDRKDDATGCDEAAKVTDAQSCAVPEHVKSYVSEHPSWVCNDCGQDRYGKPNGMSTWHYDYCRFCGEFVPCTEPRDFGDRLGDRHDGEPVETVWACPACAGLLGGHDCGQEADAAAETHEDLQGKDADSFVVTSCPECDSVTDIDYGTVKDKPPNCQGYEPEPARSAIGAGPLFGSGPELLTSTVNSPRDVVTVRDDNLSVPFSAQEWMFESLCEVEIENLHDLIDDHHDLIIEMARDRFRAGYAKYGSTMYSWSPERRLDETLQELADATVYPTSGPME